MITLVMRAGSDVNTQQVIELVQRTIGFAVQDATEIAAGLASCKELIIPNLIDSAAIAFAHAASKAGVECDLEPIIESQIERETMSEIRYSPKDGIGWILGRYRSENWVLQGRGLGRDWTSTGIGLSER